MLLQSTEIIPAQLQLLRKWKNLVTLHLSSISLLMRKQQEINNLNIRKISQKTDIPVIIIKENIDIVSYFLYHNFNDSLSCSTFPTCIKYAEVTPIHKKDDKTDKENYRPISILFNLSKVYERLMYNQIYPCF